MNAPTLYDRFIVPEGQRKVSFVADTKVASAGTFTVQREDHTLGNLIRMCVGRARRGGCGAFARVPPCPNSAPPCVLRRTPRRQLHSDDKVIFAGYQLPHPLVNEMKIKARARSTRAGAHRGRARSALTRLLSAPRRSRRGQTARGSTTRRTRRSAR